MQQSIISKDTSPAAIRLEPSASCPNVCVSGRGTPLILLVPCPRNNMAFVAIKMRRRQGGRSGAYLNGYVTDEQRGRRPIFIATLRAAAGWLVFPGGLSL